MTISPTIQKASLLTLLREATGDLHARAERHPIQASLIRGQVDSAGYAAYLRLMLRVHREVESALSGHLRHPVLSPVHRDQFRAGLIESDLQSLGHAASPGPLSPAQRAFALAARGAGPHELLGMQYVLEGSTNGGRFLARSVAAGLGLAPGVGTAYLDPHGAEQQPRWKAFAAAVDAVDCTGPEEAAVVDGAVVMFGSLIQIFDDAQRGSGSPN